MSLGKEIDDEPEVAEANYGIGQVRVGPPGYASSPSYPGSPTPSPGTDRCALGWPAWKTVVALTSRHNNPSPRPLSLPPDPSPRPLCLSVCQAYMMCFDFPTALLYLGVAQTHFTALRNLPKVHGWPTGGPAEALEHRSPI